MKETNYIINFSLFWNYAFIQPTLLWTYIINLSFDVMKFLQILELIDFDDQNSFYSNITFWLLPFFFMKHLFLFSWWLDI